MHRPNAAPTPASQRPAVEPQPWPPVVSRKQRFLASAYWRILKNVLGWLLIVAALAAAPLPGPGGIPLFLIGFALISFPGKRRLTARVLRGRPVTFHHGRLFRLIAVGVALIAAGLALPLAPNWPGWFATARSGAYANGPLGVAIFCLAIAGAVWFCVRVGPAVLNLVLRVVARARRKVRPWLRHRRIRLLPPRWRRRHPHEVGSGPLRLTDEILRFTKSRRRPA